MKWILLALAAGTVAITGCVSKSKARADAVSAYQQGLFDAQRQSQQTNQAAVVLVRGDVRKPVIQWNNKLTLSRALVMAEYRGLATPRDIIVTRKGESYHIRPKQLLSGADDPMLNPGDIVEVIR
jgi:hypothetical protein